MISLFFPSEKVFRLKPVLDEHVTLIKDLAKSIEVPIYFHTTPHLNSAIFTHYGVFTGLLMVQEAKLGLLFLRDPANLPCMFRCVNYF